LRPAAGLPDGAAVPDVVLYVTRQKNQGGDVLSYAYQWLQAGWPRQEAGSLSLQTSVEAWVEGYYDRCTQLARPAANGDSSREDIQNVGENLYHDLFTPELREGLARFGPTARTLLIFSNEPWIPWEAIRPWGREVPDELKEFLGARFQLARWYTNSQGRQFASALVLRHMTAILPAVNLAAVQRESNYLTALRWGGLHVEPLQPRSAADVLSSFAAGSAELFHFATHGRLSAKTPAVADIVLGRDNLEVTDLVGDRILDGLSGKAPLVFINACHSGRRASGLTQLEGWADRFIELGCSAFLGANWEVRDDLAAQFAMTFYDALQAGCKAAEAVQQARAAIRNADPDNSTWLAYTLFGHPNLAVRAADD